MEAVEREPRFFDADSVPELQFARLRYRQQAEDTLNKNRQLLMDGEWEAVPIPVDALGTARKVVETGKRFGKTSEHYLENNLGLIDDSSRLYGEAYRKNSWEGFPSSVQKRDEITGDYYSHNQSVTTIVEGGLSPVAKPGEQLLRIDDFVEELTYKAIGNMSLDEPVSVLTVLECPEWVIEEYSQNPNGNFYGYVPEIKKLMLRGMTFYNKLGLRVEEQMALSGLHITHEVVLAALEETERITRGTKLTKTELHGKQFIDAKAEDVWEFAKKLDAKASQLSGKNIFMGEEVEPDQPKDYELAKAEAQKRNEQLHSQSVKLARYIIELVENDVDRWAAETLVINFVDTDLKKASLHNPDLAEIIYDKKTADGYREIAYLSSQGFHAEAKRLEAQVNAEAPPISFCGAGSCGLEQVSMNSRSAQKAKELGLVGNQMHDTERSCPGCGRYTVNYDKRGSKVCTHCTKKEIKT